MEGGMIGENGVNAPYHAEKVTKPEHGLVITLLQNMVALTALAKILRLRDAMKLRAQVSRNILR